MEKIKIEYKTIYEKFESLELKSWFRLVKVIYIGILIIIFLIGVSLLWGNKPYKVVDDTKSYIQCVRDKGTGLVYYLDKNSWYGNVEGNTAYFAPYIEQSVRQTCDVPIDPNTGKPSTYIYIHNQVNYINYTFYPSYKTEGSYRNWVWSYIIFLGIFFIGVRIIKEVFYYIITGKKMFKKISFYKNL